jgi:hypothetical protein
MLSDNTFAYVRSALKSNDYTICASCPLCIVRMLYLFLFIKHDCPDVHINMKIFEVKRYVYLPTFSRMRSSSEGRRFVPRLSLLIFAFRIRFSLVTLYSARVQEVWNTTQNTLCVAFADLLTVEELITLHTFRICNAVNYSAGNIKPMKLKN